MTDDTRDTERTLASGRTVSELADALGVPVGILEDIQAMEDEVERLREGIRQHRESVNRGLWPPNREDHMLWALLDRKDDR